MIAAAAFRVMAGNAEGGVAEAGSQNILGAANVVNIVAGGMA